MDLGRAIDEHQEILEHLRVLAPDFERIVGEVVRRVRAGGTVFWFGNGGSASQAQHLAAELVGRYEHERAGLPSVALTADTALLTAMANDYSFDVVFARQLEALCGPGDVAIGLSTSGNSPNVVRGLEAAVTRRAYTVALTGGDGGKAATVAADVIAVPATRTCRIQEAHLVVGHLLCERVEQEAGAPSLEALPGAEA